MSASISKKNLIGGRPKTSSSSMQSKDNSISKDESKQAYSSLLTKMPSSKKDYLDKI